MEMGTDSSCCWCSRNVIVWIKVVYCIASIILIGGISTYAVNYVNSKELSRLYVQDLFVPSLAIPGPGMNRTTTFNSSVLVELRFERAEALSGLHQKEFEMTLFYGQSQSRNFPVGSSMVEGFSMRRKIKRVHVTGKVEAVAMPWQEALQAITAGNIVTMVLQLRMPPDNNILYTADVAVDASARIKEPIQFH